MGRSFQNGCITVSLGYPARVNLTIKGVPEELGAALKQAAQRANRSLNGEIIHRLGSSLRGDVGTVPLARLHEDPGVIADAWEALAGKWKSDLRVEEEIAMLYESRSGGRDLDLTW